MAGDEVARLAADHRTDALGHELGVPGVEVSAPVAGERLQLEIEEFEDVQRAGFVLLEKLGVAALESVAVENPFVDQVLGPFVVAVTGEQGVVEIEEGELHGRRAFA